MYKRILVATDGSKLSTAAVAHAATLAHTLGAALIGFHVRAPFPAYFYGEAVALPPASEHEFELDTERRAELILDAARAIAAKAGVSFRGIHRMLDRPADGIIAVAKKEKCDLIVMASHGRRGVARLLVGSEAMQVLTHSKIPVLLTR